MTNNTIDATALKVVEEELYKAAAEYGLGVTRFSLSVLQLPSQENQQIVAEAYTRGGGMMSAYVNLPFSKVAQDWMYRDALVRYIIAHYILKY